MTFIQEKILAPEMFISSLSSSGVNKPDNKNPDLADANYFGNGCGFYQANSAYMT